MVDRWQWVEVRQTILVKVDEVDTHPRTPTNIFHDHKVGYPSRILYIEQDVNSHQLFDFFLDHFSSVQSKLSFFLLDGLCS